MSTDRIVDLVVKYSKSMGYEIVAQQIPPEFKGSAFRIDALLASRIA